MSLENQVRPDVPPFFIWHTVKIRLCPWKTACCWQAP